MEANIVGFNGIVFSVVGDVPVDSKTPVVTSSISRFAGSVFEDVRRGRICRFVFEDAHRGKICVCVFIGVSVCAL